MILLGLFVLRRSGIKKLVNSLNLIAIFCVFFSTALFGAQEAIVMADQAIIYADQQLSAPIGFVRRGKRITVGEVPRNRAQVYPIVVAGKVAYIRIIDISTQKEFISNSSYTTQRFKKTTETEFKTNYSFSLFSYSSQIGLSQENVSIQNNDAIEWYGASIKGGIQVSPRWDFDLMLNFLNAKSSAEVYRAVEFGLGTALRIYDYSRFKLRLFTQLLAVPFSSYAVGDVFRVNGYGFGAGAGLSGTYRFGKNWGLEAYGGYYYNKLMGFDVPAPYKPVAPSFVGSRIGVGLNYQF